MGLSGYTKNRQKVGINALPHKKVNDMKLKWIACMALGLVCGVVKLTPNADNKFYWWLLSWWGFWAYDTGYKDWFERQVGE